MTWRDITAGAVQVCGLAVLVVATWFAFTTAGYPLLFVVFLGIGWLAGLVGVVAERRGARKAAAAAFLIVALITPTFFALVVNMLLVVTIVAYVIASRRRHIV